MFKKISLKSISDVLSSKELKNIKGGSGEDGCDGSMVPCYCGSGYRKGCGYDSDDCRNRVC